jgi:hypothetical protein
MLDLGQRPGKRPRTQSAELKQEEADGRPTYEQHPELWFTDGNLVVVAEKTAFRIYRGVLVKHSAVLEDKLASVLDDGQIMYEGSPVLVLDDPAEWVAEMLALMFSLKTCVYLRSYRVRWLT